MELKSFTELPGPWGLPFLGSLLDLKEDQGKTLYEWSERYYGPVFRVRVGAYQYVSLQGKDAINEALIKKWDCFNGRLDNKVIRKLRDGKGLFFNDMGKSWETWHKFAVEALSKTIETFQKATLNEAHEFTEFWGSSLNSPVNIQETLLQSMLNPILQTCFSTKYDLNDPKAKELYDIVYDSVVDPTFGKLLYLPILEHFLSFKRYLKKTGALRKKRISFLQDMLVERRKKTELSSIDLVTCYDQSLQAAQYDEFWDDEYFAAFVGDLLFAGTATTANQILWVLFYLLKYPRCMELVQEELSSVLEEKFSVEKVNDLHYTKAAIEETFRLRPISPALFLSKTSKDTSIQGYKIPKNTSVFVNLWSVHNDKAIWGPDPQEFRPERHLDKLGKFRKSDNVLPFSLGQRSCSGKNFAYTGIITYVSTILLKYKITLASESINVSMDGHGVSILKPNPFQVLLQPIDNSS